MSDKKNYGFQDRSQDPQFEPVQAQPLEVKVYNNFDKASKAFRALVQKERILSIYKEKQSYEKPSDKKRRKRAEMKKRLFELELKIKRMMDGDFEKSKKDKYPDSE